MKRRRPAEVDPHEVLATIASELLLANGSTMMAADRDFMPQSASIGIVLAELFVDGARRCPAISETMRGC